MAALYSDQADEPPDEKILDVWICKMRKNLKPFGIEVKTHWGESWEIPEASKAIARESLPSWPRPAVKDVSRAPWQRWSAPGCSSPTTGDRATDRPNSDVTCWKLPMIGSQHAQVAQCRGQRHNQHRLDERQGEVRRNQPSEVSPRCSGMSLVSAHQLTAGACS
jgi:hypothetical protein